VKKAKSSRPYRDERPAPVVPPNFISAQTMLTARAGVHCNLNTAPGRVPKVPYNGLHLSTLCLRHLSKWGSLSTTPYRGFTF